MKNESYQELRIKQVASEKILKKKLKNFLALDESLCFYSWLGSNKIDSYHLNDSRCESILSEHKNKMSSFRENFKKSLEKIFSLGWIFMFYSWLESILFDLYHPNDSRCESILSRVKNKISSFRENFKKSWEKIF